MRELIHEIRNQLAVAIGNVEGFRDGILEPTRARLDAVLAALGRIEVLLSQATSAEREERTPKP
jgi:signal transduction histidine kinase